ncbi:MAG: TRAP transporter small permease [Acidihalobacter sp.]
MSLREGLHRLEEGLIAFLLAAMTVLTFVQVVLRYVFNSGFIWQLEADYYLFSWLVMIGISYCVRVRAHIGVDAAVRMLPRGPRRAVGIFVLLLALAYTLLMLYGSVDYLHKIYIINIEAEDIPVATWKLSLCLPLGFVLLFFTFSATKLPHYMLYGCTPLFVLLARYREQLRSRWLALLPAMGFVGLVLALPTLAKHLADRAPNGYYRMVLEQGPQVFGVAYYVVPVLAFVAICVLLFWPRWPVWQRTLIAGVLSILVLMQSLMPALGALQQQPVKDAALLAKKLGGPAVMWDLDMPSFSVYRQAVTPQIPPKPGDLVFTRADHLDRLAKLGHYKVLYEHGGIVLARFLGPHA